MTQDIRIPAASKILALLAILIVASLGMQALKIDGPVLSILSWPGLFLFKSFHLLSLYVPAFLSILAIAACVPRLKSSFFIPLVSSIVPFFTVSILLRLVLNSEPSLATQWFLAHLGPVASQLFLALLFVFEVLLITTISVIAYQSRKKTAPSFQQEKQQQQFQRLDFGSFWDEVPFSEQKNEDSFSQFNEKVQPSPVAEAHHNVQTTKPKDADQFSERINSFTQDSSCLDLRNDFPFDVSEGACYHSLALDALSETLSKFPIAENVQSQEDIQNQTEENQTLSIDHPVLDSSQTTDHHAPEENLIVDWDKLKTIVEEAPFDKEEEELEASEEEEDFDREMEDRLTKELNYQKMVERIFSEPEPYVLSESDDYSEVGDSAESTSPTLEVPKQFPQEQNHVSGERLFTAIALAQRPKLGQYHVPVAGLLTTYKKADYSEIDESTKRAAHTLKMTLQEFNINADVTGIRKGPVVTMFELLPAAGVKLSKIVALQDNIALGLAATSIRIVAPIPGKHAVGIEVPNRERTIVGFAEIIMDAAFKENEAQIPIVLGKNISGEPQIIDLTRTPHLLIAGATGAGKSVCVNTLICSILYRRSPDEVKLLLIDPKVVELKFFNNIPHLLTPVITEPKKALQAVQWCLYEMERRYALLDALGAKDICSYNAKIEKRHIATTKLPYIVLVIDEFADLMATSGKELEGTIARLAAMSRAVGIHLVLATQRPSVDVITGLIKANFPSRIAFMVASRTDSRIIIDQMGAEKLLGRGDMLFTSSWHPFPNRLQGAFLSEEDVERVVAYVKTLGEPQYISEDIFYDEESEADLSTTGISGEIDPLFDKGVEIVRTFKKASASFLQRRLGVGYNRAARMIETMEELGMIGPQNGSKPREVVHS